jgi:hypothetical protein
VIEYTKTNSYTSVQRAFRKRFRTDPPPRASVQRWSDNLENQGCTCKKKSSGRPRVSDEAVRQVDATFNRSARKSVRKESTIFIPDGIQIYHNGRRICYPLSDKHVTTPFHLFRSLHTDICKSAGDRSPHNLRSWLSYPRGHECPVN